MSCDEYGLPDSASDRVGERPRVRVSRGASNGKCQRGKRAAGRRPEDRRIRPASANSPSTQRAKASPLSLFVPKVRSRSRRCHRPCPATTLMMVFVASIDGNRHSGGVLFDEGIRTALRAPHRKTQLFAQSVSDVRIGLGVPRVPLPTPPGAPLAELSDGEMACRPARAGSRTWRGVLRTAGVAVRYGKMAVAHVA